MKCYDITKSITKEEEPVAKWETTMDDSDCSKVTEAERMLAQAEPIKPSRNTFLQQLLSSLF